MKRYLVTADHVSPNWRFVDHEAIAKPSPGHDGYWYATSPRLGCSRDYAKPDDAVRSLFYANACTNLKLKEI